MRTAIIVLVSLSSIVGFAEDAAEPQSLSQYPLSPINVKYSLHVDNPIAKLYAKDAAMGNGISYELAVCEGDKWMLKQILSNKISIETIMDGRASILSEKSVIKETTASPETTTSPETTASLKKERLDDPNGDLPDKENVRRKKKEGFWSKLRFWEKENSEEPEREKPLNKERKHTHSQLESTRVSLEDDPIFGLTKAIEFLWRDGKSKKMLILPDEIITSFLQIVVWSGTIERLPQEGERVRWCLDGNPYPMLVKDESTNENIIFSVYRGETIATDINRNDRVFEFVFSKEGDVFRMPEKITFSPSPKMALVLKKEK